MWFVAAGALPVGLLQTEAIERLKYGPHFVIKCHRDIVLWFIAAGTLPAGLPEIEAIERARARREFEKNLPPVSEVCA